MHISNKTTQLGFQNIKIYIENMETSRGSKGFKDTKNHYWRKYCELLGKNTPLDSVQLNPGLVIQKIIISQQ